MKATFTLIIFTVLLSGCISLSRRDGLPRNYRSFNAQNIADAVPKVEPKSRRGNPKSYVVFGKRYYVLKSARCYRTKGIASWYGTAFHQRLTSSGEPYNMYRMTAANKTLPLPSYVRVTNLKNGRRIIVKVNDRGPFHANRVIDLSFVAAKKIGMLATGTALVEVEAIDPRDPNRRCGSSNTIAKETNPEIYLQLGAFSDKFNADQFVNTLVSHVKHPIHVIINKTSHGYIYKVQIGPIKDVAIADTLTTQLKAKGFGDAFAVVH